jgi:type IV pilus biogenesis protein CpaD/CtpE
MDPFRCAGRPYWNLGCAMQSNVASQIADPVDLVRGRQEGRIDTASRSRGHPASNWLMDPFRCAGR